MRCTSLELSTQRLDGTELISARGEVDLATSPQLAQAVATALSEGPKRLVIDLCEVGFLDSSGLAVLLQTRRRARPRHIALRIVCDVPSTLRVLTLTGLDRVFEVRPSRREALET